MMKQEIKRALLDFICRNYMVEEHEFEMDKSLVDQGIIDSFGLVELSTHMTQTYGFTVEENDMNRENFGSVEKMTAFIEKRASA
ncbi:MAG: acyl carrier protein [Chitinivibrionales bacterium]